MKKFEFNDSINKFEIDPRFIPQGIKHAIKNDFRKLRIFALSDTESQIPLNLAPLKDMDWIECIDIHDNFIIKNFDVSSLNTLKNLKSLSIDYQLIKNNIPENLCNLNELFLYGKNQIVEDLTLFKNLKKLSITVLKNTDFSIFKNLKELEFLIVSGASSENISGIEGVEKLKKIKLTYCSKLNDISSINKLANLEELHVEKCKLLHDYEFLNGNSNIKNLFITELDSLKFINNMKSLSSIYFWDLKDGDFQPIFHSKSIKKVHFSKQKKNYSNSREEVELFLSQNNHG